MVLAIRQLTSQVTSSACGAEEIDVRVVPEMYYFRLRVGDERPNWSDLSNSTSDRTLSAIDVLVEGTFEHGSEGWSASDNSGVGPTWRQESGNPPPCLRVEDDHSNDIWFWEAPSKFEGDQSAALSGRIEFELLCQGYDEDYNEKAGVILESPTLTLVATFESPSGTWSARSIPLTATGTWRKGSETGSAASLDDLRQVLTTLSRLAIRGDTKKMTETDWGSLDNVRIRRP